MDGCLARRWGVCSDGGAKLDLFCDSYCVSPPILLILHAMAPLHWKSILNGYTTLLAGLTVVSSWAKLENMKISFGCLVITTLRRKSGSV
ncbi:MAG: hypothetical protein GX900_07410 [Clostridiaceae bacterium]|nr:hypothetical protein [Clostridiaceae bacterium]